MSSVMVVVVSGVTSTFLIANPVVLPTKMLLFKFKPVTLSEWPSVAFNAPLTDFAGAMKLKVMVLLDASALTKFASKFFSLKVTNNFGVPLPEMLIASLVLTTTSTVSPCLTNVLLFAAGVTPCMDGASATVRLKV